MLIHAGTEVEERGQLRGARALDRDGPPPTEDADGADALPHLITDISADDHAST